MWPQVNGAEEGITSITHYELLQAKGTTPNGRRTAASRSWRSCWTRATPGRPNRSTVLRRPIRLPRQTTPLSASCELSFSSSESSPFASPSDLEARVSTAVTMATAGLQVELNLVPVGDAIELKDSDPLHDIHQAIINAGRSAS